MISAIHPRFHRLPGFLALTCAASMGLSSCSMFKKTPQAPPAVEPLPYEQPQKPAAHPQGPRPPKPKPAPGPAAVAPPVERAPSGPAPQNPDSSSLSSSVSGNSAGNITSVPVSGKYIALTFDDGPSPKNTPRLLAMLRQRNIKATFFCVGENVSAYPGIARQITSEGHEIANHSYNHPLLTKLGDDAFKSQITRTHQAIVSATGVTPSLIRPPYGAATPGQRQWMSDQYSYHCILWSVDPLDWKNRNSATVRSRILAGTKPGGIILAHDIHGTTVDAMPATLDELLRRGYQFVTVSQLLAMRSGG